MADLKAQEHAEHVDLVEQLSRELIATRACLLDAEKKGEYDALLRKRLGAGKRSAALAEAKRQNGAIEHAVQQATARLIASRNQLRAQAQKTSQREKLALLQLQQMRHQWEVTQQAVNSLTPSFSQPKSPISAPFHAQSQFPDQQKRKWFLSVLITASAAAVVLLIIGAPGNEGLEE